MLTNIQKATGAAAAAIFALAGSANAAFFSFASDTADHNWTFTGSGANVNNATTATDPVVLMIDDNNGTQTPLQISTQFSANATLSFAGDVALGGGVFSHNYLANGSFSFRDIASGTLLLTVNFQDALFTARGNANSWFTTAALQGDNNGGSVTYIWSGASLPLYNLTPGSTPGDFAYGLSTLNSSGIIPYNGQSPGVGLGSDHLPSSQWWSEASYSGSTLVPAPGVLAMLGLSGLAAARRRR